MIATAAPNLASIAANLWNPKPSPEAADRAACAADSAVFVERHCTIEEPDGTVLPFELWDCQRETLTALETESGVIILKARRLGMSWVVLAFALWLAIFQQGIRILILCKKEGDANKLLDRIRRMRDRMAANPDSAHILAGFEKGRDAVTTLSIGKSTIMALVGTEDSARSETCGFLILDEFAFQVGAAGIWQGGLPTIEGGGRMAVLSTGNGREESESKGAEFAKQWRRAVQGISGFKALFYGWRARPGRDDAWYARTLAAIGDATKMRIEYPSTEDDAFLVDNAKLIYPGSHLDAIQRLGEEMNRDDGRHFAYGMLGIDWGVHTHMVAAVELPSGGVRLLSEYFSDGAADIEIDAIRCAAMLQELRLIHIKIRYDPGGAGAKVIGTFLTNLKRAAPWLTLDFEDAAVPFSKFKVVAIQYAQLLARRAADGETMRVLAADPKDVPKLLSQMRSVAWKNTDIGKTEKGNDHGADAVLTLTAGPGYRWSQATTNTDHDQLPERGF
jgi:hypothetical protein